jgi:citrate synthase
VATDKAQATENGGAENAQADNLTVIDNRTNENYDIEITEGTARAMDFRQIKVDEGDFGLMTYDPGLSNTAHCRSSICYIGGEEGTLEYRGIPIDQLAEHSNYLEVAYLLIYGHLPTEDELNDWVYQITHHTFVHENIKNFMEGFRYDADPMGMLLASVAALSTFYPEAKQIQDEHERHMAAVRLIAKMPTLAAFAYRHSLGLPYVYPDNELSYAGNFLSMLFKMAELKYEPDPRIERALDVLFILHADHEQNCSTATVRNIGSALADPYTAIAGGVAALYGPLHGGANIQVVQMLQRIGSTDNVLDFLEGVKNGDELLMGFGHRVYKNYDPRAKIIQKHIDELLEATGKPSPLLDIGRELEKRALDDEYFTSRALYPNVDFYSGVIYEALGLPTEMFTVMFAVPRTSGWMAQWMEWMNDPERRIARPRQVYTGARDVDYVPVEER